MRAGAHLLVIVVVRVVADDNEGHKQAKGDEGRHEIFFHLSVSAASGGGGWRMNKCE